MRKKTIMPDRILSEVIKSAAQNGLFYVSTAEVAASLSISEGTIFNNYKTKQDLLTACFESIDREMDAVLSKVHFQGFSIKRNITAMLDAYMDYWISHPDNAAFYSEFRHSAYYTQEIVDRQNDSFSFFIKLIQKNKQVFNINIDLFWTFAIETSLNFAVRIANGTLPGDQKSREQMYSLLFYGLSAAFKKDSKFQPLDSEDLSDNDESSSDEI